MAASSSSATVAVEKATSDLLMGPDWTMNIEICDSINSNYWQPKDVVKAVKKRLQHRSSKVQLLALTLLETMVKNCGDYVHFQIAERNILEEMIKIVRKKADMHVRDKILVLLDSWQEAFGGPGGKYPQYYWAYEELRRSGVVFPKRSPDAAPIFTPPPTHPTLRHMQAGYGMPSNSSKTLDETMATEIESLSLSSLESMRQVVDLLSDMLQAVNPSDRAAVKDEVIVDLVDRCRTNQKKLMQMLTTTGDEELLGRGLELNDSIQSLLARHDAIASGTPFPIQGASSSTLSTEVHSSVNQTEIKSSSPVESVSTPKASPPVPVYSETRGHQSDEEEEDEFAQLARRHSKTQSVTSKDATTGSSEGSVSMNTSSTTPHVPEPSTSVPSNALALPDPPPPNQHHQYPARYPPPPWAATPGYPNYQNHLSATNVISTPQANTTASYTPATGVRPLQPTYSFPTPGISGSAVRGDPRGNSGPRNPTNGTGQKPFIPSYRLFEDLNVFGNTDGRVKMTGSGTSSSMSGTMGPGMVGGRK
ncbi:VHS domain [Sesbania bispinosa]|nr:VHS domain [Sesbania bispinosa]